MINLLAFDTKRVASLSHKSNASETDNLFLNMYSISLLVPNQTKSSKNKLIYSSFFPSRFPLYMHGLYIVGKVLWLLQKKCCGLFIDHK